MFISFSLHFIGGFLNSPLVLRYRTINGTDVAVIPILTGANTEVDRYSRVKSSFQKKIIEITWHTPQVIEDSCVYRH